MLEGAAPAGYARQIGAAPVNRAGIAPDAAGQPMICFQGSAATLNILEGLPEASYWSEWNVLAVPLTKVNMLVMETVAQVEAATDDYVAERTRLLSAPSAYQQLYPEPFLGDFLPRAHQVEAFCASLHAFDQGWRGFGQFSEQGLGKGHPEGTKILTPSGWRSIETLQAGDAVIGANGRSTPVTGVYRRGVLPLYRVTFNDGATICVDGDHLWSVERHTDRHRKGGLPGRYRVMSTEALIGKLAAYWYVPLVGPVEFEPQGSLPLAPYVLGVLLGDGSLTLGGCSFTAARETVVQAVRDALPAPVQVVPVDQPGKTTAWYLTETTPGIKGSNRVLNAIRTLGLAGRRSHEKFVPVSYLHASPLDRLALLQGLMDTDGSQTAHDGHLEFGSSSKELAEAVQFLVQSLGGVARIHFRARVTYRYRGEDRTGLPCYRVSIKMAAGLNPFRARAADFRPKTKYHAMRCIKSIEPCGEGPVICLSVAAPDSLYVTEQFIVTHNTRWAIDLMRRKVSRCAVVIGQNSTCYQWEEQLQRSWPTATVSLLVGKPVAKRLEALAQFHQQSKLGLDPTPHIFILNWESLARMIGSLTKLKPDMVVADEATRMIHRTTQMSRAAFVLAKHSTYRVAMTGTPVGNDPGDLFALYRFIDERLFGTSYPAYVKHYFFYGGLTNQEFLGFHPTRLPEFVGRMYTSAYRITKATATDMPEKTYREVRLDMLPDQKRLYKKVAEDLYAEWVDEYGETTTLSVPNAMVKMVRLQQITAGYMPASVNPEETAAPVWSRLPSAKLNWLRQYLLDTLNDTDAQLIIWTRFIPEMDMLRETVQELGIAAQVAHIDGRVPPKNRETIRQRFNDRHDPLRVLLMQIQAGAMGLDLPGADVMIYHTIPFSLVQRLQSIDRGHRLGRARPYEIIDLICKASVDNHVLQALKRKQSVADMLLSDGFTPAIFF